MKTRSSQVAVKSSGPVRILGCTLLVAAGVCGAQTVPVPPPATQVPPVTAVPKRAPAPKPAPVQIAPEATEKILSGADERVVLGKLTTTLHFASKDSGLAIKRPVKGKFVTRAQVEAELRQKFEEDEGAKRLQRSELVLKKFGLLDREFKLRPFLLSLLTEQIAGFYDDKTHDMTLLNWVPLKEQEPVMAHELTHALQDQAVGLKQWGDQEAKGVAKDAAEDNAHIAKDEADTAREAVTEGQAMITFADYELKDTGKTLRDVPELGERLKAGAGDVSGSPVLQRAPLVLQQSLLFPYVEGLGFEQAVLVKQGVPAAFAAMLQHPPSSSYEVMNPDAFMRHAAVPVLRMPDVHPLLSAAGWEPYDVGVMGELDVRMLTELFGGRPMAEALAPSWAGGVYLAMQKTGLTAAQMSGTPSLGLMYVSRWQNEASARNFFAVYDGQMPRKYNRLERAKSEEHGITERVYRTEEGDVLISQQGNGVFVSEGFDLVTARKLQGMVNAAQGSGPLREASLPVRGHELAGGLASWMGSFGMMRAALHP